MKSYLQFRRNRGYMDTNPISSTLRSLDDFLQEKGIKQVQEISKQIVLEWFGRQQNHQPQGRRQRLSNINNFFKYLQRVGVIKGNPACGIIIKGSKYQPYIYNLKEICDILSEAKKITENPKTLYQGRLYYTLIYLIYALALRLSEALNIRLKDIDFNQKTIFIYKGKFGKERLLPFSKNTEVKLKKFIKLRLKIYPPKNNEEPLFCNKYHKSYSKSTVESKFRKFTIACGLVNLSKNPPRIHDLRHSAATHILYKWYSERKDILNRLPLLSRYLGHVDISSTQIYLTISNTLLKKASKYFEEKFAPVSKLSKKLPV